MLLALTAVLLCAAPDAGVPDVSATNLVALAKVWEQVRLFHPWLYERELDWDQAWVKAAPKAEAARTPDELTQVIAELLSTLKDPASRVRAKPPPAVAGPGVMGELRGGVPVLYPGRADFERAFGSAAGYKALDALIKGQERLVVDLRGTGGLWLRLAQVPGFGPSKDARAPSVRSVVHHGYAASAGLVEDYYAAFEEALRPVVQKVPGSPRRYAFLVGPDDRLPTVALAMQAAGEGFVVATAPLDDGVAGLTASVPIDASHVAEVRVQALVGRGFAPDLVIPGGKDPLDAAVALVRGKAPVKPPPASSAAPARAVLDRDYAETPFPSRELRQLAGVRFWMIARRFWAYPHLAGEDYDRVLADFLPRLAAAGDQTEYAQTVAELTTHLPDGHTTLAGVRGGRAMPPLLPRVIEKQFVVWRLLPEAEQAGVARGDVLLEIDGRPVAEREAELAKITAASHPEALRAKIAGRLLAGAPATKVRLTLQQAGGVVKQVELTRGDASALWDPKPGPHFKVLEGNLGYVDLSALELPEVDAMMTALAGTRAIIFDDRGYPKGTPFKFGPRLDTRHPKGVAQFYEPLVTAFSEPNSGRYFLQSFEKAEGPLYTNPTVVLIDDQAISHAEHCGLIFEAYAGSTFIGSPTAGANGDVSFAPLPGGLRLMFTGHDVRHADGRQLQRIGLVPDVEARPTVAGLRAGRDEVLEAALGFLKKKLK